MSNHDNKNEEPKEQRVDNSCKVFISRIPKHFDENSVQRLVETALLLKSEEGSKPLVGGGDSNSNDDAIIILNVGLKYEEEDDDDGDENNEDDEEDRRGGCGRSKRRNKADEVSSSTKPHKGFAFMEFASPETASAVIALGSIKGGAKPNSTKKHRIYLSAVDDDDDDDNNNTKEIKKKVCFLWQNYRCPYGDGCKFDHSGDGGCMEQKLEEGNNNTKKRKRKCWDYQKKGKCKLGDECPFLHCNSSADNDTKEDSAAAAAAAAAATKKHAAADRPKSEKDCINWKTKGKCRKGDQCPYRHDEALREKALAKKKKKTTTNIHEEEAEVHSSSTKKRQQQQPLSVRVFGLNYETKETDIREYFKDCGIINNVVFPTFEDSGRSKGYCEILFASPKAVIQAVKLNSQELHGRWLSVQAGKMYLKEWEQQEHDHQHSSSARRSARSSEGPTRQRKKKKSRRSDE